MGSCCSNYKAVVKAQHSVNEQSGGAVHRSVTISKTQVGPDIQTSSMVVYGKGTACASEYIQYDRVYFEILVRTTGKIAVGVAQPATEPEKAWQKMIGDNKTSWALRSDMLAATPVAGDVFGVKFDRFGNQEDAGKASPRLSFTLNGLPLGDMYDIPQIAWSPAGDKVTHRMNPLANYYPAISVDKGASVEFIFSMSSLKQKPPVGYQTVVVRDTGYGEDVVCST